MNSFLLMLSLMQTPGLTVQTGHDEPGVGRERAPVVVREPVVREAVGAGLTARERQMRVRQFEARFNKLVEAVEEFSQAYNGARGQVWPADKVAALRKAMEDLQKAERSLRAER